jgi:DNA-binding winged helix-turn-helix (wHTH) protein
MAVPMMSSSTLHGRGGQLAAANLQNRYLSFGQFQVDLQREELIKDGERMRVPSKVYQVLMALLEKPGQVVTREDLRMRLWPEGTYVNYDANVNTTVNKLRLALGDSPDSPTYVETIPRQGYCFVGSVERKSELVKDGNAVSLPLTVTEAPAAPIGPAPLRSTFGPRLRGMLADGWAAAMLLCGVLLGIGIVLIAYRPK